MLRDKLIKDGHFQHLLDGGDPEALDPRGGDEGAGSGGNGGDDAISPVLMEVLQASSRVSVPDAARRRVWELCVPVATLTRCHICACAALMLCRLPGPERIAISLALCLDELTSPALLPARLELKSQMRYSGACGTMPCAHVHNVCLCRRRRAGLPPLPDDELARAIRRLKFGSAALQLAPATMHLSTQSSWDSLQPHRGHDAAARGSGGAAPRLAARYKEAGSTPEQRALAQRQLALGMRTVAYGSAVTVTAFAGAATALAWHYNIRSFEECRGALHAWGKGLQPRLRAAMLPWREYMQSLMAPRHGGERSEELAR